MPDFTRDLLYRSPMMRGPDVLYAQRALLSMGLDGIEADGLFGKQTAAAVTKFQKGASVPISGIIDQTTWRRLFRQEEGLPAVTAIDIKGVIARLKAPQHFRDSVSWRLSDLGIAIGEQAATGTAGEPATVKGILGHPQFGPCIAQFSVDCEVPVELIVATIATETRGKLPAVRHEPGFRSSADTPDRISIGPMQTLLSTARDSLGKPELTDVELGDPAVSIKAGTCYIKKQFSLTGFDPPKVACAYNAGGLYYNPSPNNRWRMRQFPIGTSNHADRFVTFFNDCFWVLRNDQKNDQNDQNYKHLKHSFAANF